ncbi:Hypothetical protein AKI40_1459 [Enterobacter sp. FY-07]|uniref:hypothetical protein n=1 Tax=Kosakonia oryzendophytica TaxID=1005665 RepID=UPI00078C8554|nr:hypothetical protein [Kosakonia oryzendophytica]AMO47873.1 Hypothetical protein AKI40_1459 [Enterobacter sp. FY-07]WBT59557.1 hypothetical protein O9K67_07215 [Kosakonia oryzendophytica]
MLFFRYLFILFALPFLLIQTGYASQQSRDETVFLTVLHTNDHHGPIGKTRREITDWLTGLQ